MRPTDVLWEHVLALQPKKNDRLIYALFTLIPPQRNADFSEMRIVEHRDDECDNLYIRSEQAFLFRNYKNVKSRGHLLVAVPDEMVELIPNQCYMFQKQNGKPLGFAALCARITRTFSALGPRVGAVTLRRSFASDQLKSGMTGVDLLRASNASSHSMKMHRFYAFKQC